MLTFPVSAVVVSFPVYFGGFPMHDKNELRFIQFCQLQMRVIVLAVASFSIAGCDKVEGLVDDVKNQVGDNEPVVADAPATTSNSTPVADTIVPEEPVVPKGPTPEEIVAQFNQIRPDMITDGNLAQLASSPEAAAAITEIDMRGAQVSESGLGYLSALPNLESLSAGGQRIRSDALAAIGKSQSLKHIDLVNSAANDRVVSELSRIPHLQTLKLDGTNVTEGSATGLGAMQELTDLSLVGTGVNDLISSSLTALPLRSLNLAKTRITDASLPSILKIETLESLNVAFCQVTGKGFKGFNRSNLKVLNVGETRFGTDGFVAIKGMKSLEELNVYKVGLVQDMKANVFRSFPKLRILNAGRNGVADPGMQVFFKGHKTLEELHLHYNKGITDNGLAALVGVKTLKLLDVSSTSCGAAGVNALQQALPDCTIRASN